MPLLLRAEGDGWSLEIIGKLPTMPPFIPTLPQSELAISGMAAVATWNAESGELIHRSPGEMIPPLFFEAVAYDIHVEKTPGSLFKLALPPGAEERRIRPASEHHTLNFGNNVGFADIGIIAPDGAFNLRLEVFSRKVDYKSDYRIMREEISAVLRNLAMTANAKTYGLAAPAKNHRPTLVEWFALLKTHFDDFVKLANAVSRKPHTDLVQRAVQRETDRARSVTRQTLSRALRRSNSGPVHPSLGVSLPRRINEHVSSITFDTAENRYFRGLLEKTYRNMRALSKVEETGDEDAERDSEKKFFASIRPDLKEMERRLEAVMKAPFLLTVGDGTLQRPTSMVFHKHPVYSRLDKLARLLNGGLSFAGDIVPVGVKDTALLYEYWCFIKIVELLRERHELADQSIVKTNRFKTTVTLAKGKASAMRFIHSPSGRDLFVVYNRVFDRLPTIAQKPDNVIQIASENRFYIFDAKYRIQFDKAYLGQFGGPGPKTEDINTMHRYRDAIAIPHPTRRKEYLRGVVQGAVVLFPYPDEQKYKAHRFYTSIEEVEIGGLPFLPGATSLLDNKLSALIDDEYAIEEPEPSDSAPPH